MLERKILLVNLELQVVTTKKLAWKGVVSELLWFIEGSDDERRLAEIRFGKERGELTDLAKYKTIWTDNADHQGKNLGYENNEYKKLLGPIYGVQWRSWDKHDQLHQLIQNLKSNPMSRRHILSAWNVAAIENMALPPCHVMSQFYVDNQDRLSCRIKNYSGHPGKTKKAPLGANLLALKGSGITRRGVTHLFQSQLQKALGKTGNRHTARQWFFSSHD